MKVSVLMNCYNSAKYLREAIDSVYAQTYTDWEIIFWDNNSSDESAEIAKSYDDKVKYYKGDVTVPLYSARNLALEKVTGDVIGFLDCDDIWLPEKLEKQMPLFKNPKVGLVYSDTFFFNETGITKRFFSDRPHFTGECFEALLDSYFLSLETVLVRTEAMKSLDYYFDDRFNMVGDADLFRRIGYSWELDMVDEPLAQWRVHENSLSWKVPEKFAEETKLMLEKYHEIFPGFEEKYPNGLKHLKRDIAIGLTKAKFQRGDMKAGREIVKDHLWSTKAKLLYGCSFLPSFVYTTAYRMYLNKIGV